ncbi:MAG: AAA family ATPase [Acidobacteria bacterium]|nr:AAA family ATPase [Acidobacteriota bacterium]
MRPPLPAGFGDVLAPNAANVADVYDRLRVSHPGLIERIHSYLRSFNPEFQSLGIANYDNYRRLKFVPTTNPAQHQFNTTQVSDGTLHAVAILIAVFQSLPASLPLSLIGLEEPENNLHPAAAGVLLDALIEASHRTPIIASTHSADLLDRKGLPENSILAFALHEGETIIGPVDAAAKEILQKRLYTAGELLRSNQLNPELPAPRT